MHSDPCPSRPSRYQQCQTKTLTLCYQAAVSMTTRQQVNYGVDFFEMDQSVQLCTPIHVKTVQTDTDYARQKTLSLCSQAVVNSTGRHRITYGMDLFKHGSVCTNMHPDPYPNRPIRYQRCQSKVHSDPCPNRPIKYQRCQ